MLYALQFFRELGIRRFIVTVDIYPAQSSNFCMINKYRDIKDNIKCFKPRGAEVRVVPSVYLAEGVAHHLFLKRLVVTRTNKIFVRTPLDADPNWLDPDLNFLLYKQKFLPIFDCFENRLDMYNHDYVSKLYKIQNAAYCLDINYMTSPKSNERIRQAIRENILILPTVVLMTNSSVYDYKNIIRSFERLRKKIGDKQYLLLCKHLNDCSITVFGRSKF